MGSFSYISKDEMVDAMKDIATNAATYAFLLTMKSVSPQSEDTMRWLQEQSSHMNALNINSCELAEQAVSAIWPQVEGARQHVCRSMNSQNGILADAARARQDCANEGKAIANTEGAGDAMIGSYNLAWNVIQKDPFLTTQPQFAELFMSITGTVIINEKGIPTHYPSKVHDASFMKGLFKGGELDCYQCSSLGGLGKSGLENIFKKSQGCLNVVEGKKDFYGSRSFHYGVKRHLENIQTSIAENTSLADEDKEILMKTPVPIGRILCALTAYNRGRCPLEIEMLAEIVSVDVICQYLKDIIRNALSTALQLRNVQMDSIAIDNFIDNLREVDKIVLEYETDSKKIFEERFQLMKMVEMIENNLKKTICL